MLMVVLGTDMLYSMVAHVHILTNKHPAVVRSVSDPHNHIQLITSTKLTLTQYHCLAGIEISLNS